MRRMFVSALAVALAPAALGQFAPGADNGTTATPAAKQQTSSTRTRGTKIRISWPPGPDVAVMYRRAGPAIPDPRLVFLGKLDSDVSAFNVPGAVRASFERAG